VTDEVEGSHAAHHAGRERPRLSRQ
jgi:hypothetical protein